MPEGRRGQRHKAGRKKNWILRKVLGSTTAAALLAAVAITLGALPAVAQQPRHGFVPLTVGSGETQEAFWVPAAMVDLLCPARSACAC